MHAEGPGRDATGDVASDGPCGDHGDLKRRVDGLQLAHRLLIDGRHSRNLAGSAARQDQQQFCVRRYAASCAKRRPVRMGHVDVQRGRADHGRRQPLALEPGRIEAIERQQMIDRPGQRLGPAGARGPDLGADIFDQRHVGPRGADGLGDANGEAPAVDQDHGVRPFALGQGRRLRDPAFDLAIGAQTLDPAQDRQFGDVEWADHALCRHARSADADKGHIVAQPRPQRLGQTGAQGVARRLGRHQHDLQRAAH